MHKFGSVQKKILLTLLGGVALGTASSPRQYFRVFRKLRKEWKKVNQQNFLRSVRKLSDEKIIEEQRLPDGSFKLILTKNGKQQARKLNLSGDFINFKKPKKWDGKWRMVSFDIPDRFTKGRKALVYRLKSGGFYELQKSLFVYPYDCEKEIRALAKLFKIEKYICLALLESIDNKDKLVHHFKLN